MAAGTGASGLRSAVADERVCASSKSCVFAVESCARRVLISGPLLGVACGYPHDHVTNAFYPILTYVAGSTCLSSRPLTMITHSPAPAPKPPASLAYRDTLPYTTYRRSR